MTPTQGAQGARRAEAALRSVLPRPARLESRGHDASGDLRVRINGTPLKVRWLNAGQLRDVENTLAGKRPRRLVVVAPHLSLGARERLSKAGVGWVDESGAAELVAGSIVVSRTGRVERKPTPARWTPSVLSVVEAVLCGAPATVAGVRKATGLSEGSCTNALRWLTELGLLVAGAKRGQASARRVADEGDLLDAYATAVAAMAAPLRLEVGVTWQDTVSGLQQIGARWDAAGVAWASTGAVAAAVMSPLLTSVSSAEVYVEADTILGLEAVAAAAALRPIDGGRLLLRPFPTTSVRRLAQEVEGLRVAPWPRVYADLRSAGVRGEEAAEHLRGARHGR